MAKRQLSVLLEGGAFFEGPRWRDGRWYVSDVGRKSVYCVDADGQHQPVLHVEGQPSGLGWLADGSLLVVSMQEHRIYRQAPSGQVSLHADVTPFCHGLLNDMVVDADGGAYAGSIGLEMTEGAEWAPTFLIRVDPDGCVRAAAEGLYCPNGMVITPDGRTLIVAETFAHRFTAFTIEPDGSLSDPRVWSQLAPALVPGPVSTLAAQLRVAPDGCALDAEGHIWMADSAGGPARRLAPGGATADEVPPPEGLIIFACMLGGDDGRTLLLCAAPEGAFGASGDGACLLTTQVETPRAGLP
jgi:sugar lactone lactonase YvrE